MEWEVYLSDDSTYIIQKMKGMIDMHEVMIATKKAHQMGKELGIHHFLVDATESISQASVTDQYEFAYQGVTAPDMLRNVVVAALVSPGDHSHDFMETVARNSGTIYKIFDNLDKALEFLEQ